MSKISELSNGGALLSTDDLIVVRSGGNVRAQLSSIDGVTIGGSTPSSGTFTSVSVDNITIDGTEIDSTGDLFLDAVGDITIDADGGDIRLSDAGTQFGKFTRSSGDFIISSSENNKDMKFAGADGGADITALTLDMSEAGAATFNAGASFGDSVGIGVGVTGLTYRIEAAATSGGNGLKITRGSGSFFEQFMSTTGGVNLAASGSGAFLAFRTGTTAGSSTERMRLDKDGNLLVSKTSNDNTTVGISLRDTGEGSFVATGQRTALFNRLSDDGEIIQLRQAGSEVGSIESYSSTIQVGQGNVFLKLANATDTITPANGNGTDNDDAIDLGASSARFNDIFATNGTIQTSDRNEKQDIEALSDSEQRVAVAAKSLLRKFRWNTSVEEKGDDARIHFGIIAQDLQDAFTAEGLDAGRYAMFISSTWTDEETGEERTRLGVRYSELLAFIISAI